MQGEVTGVASWQCLFTAECAKKIQMQHPRTNGHFSPRRNVQSISAMVAQKKFSKELRRVFFRKATFCECNSCNSVELTGMPGFQGTSLCRPLSNSLDIF